MLLHVTQRVEVIVEMSGERLRLKHMSRGQDDNATLQTDIIVNGRVPLLAETSNIRVLPYSEDFVQVATGTFTMTQQREFVNGLFLTDVKSPDVHTCKL